eukprot:1530361-Prymnesium_polylepis.1
MQIRTHRGNHHDGAELAVDAAAAHEVVDRDAVLAHVHRRERRIVLEDLISRGRALHVVADHAGARSMDEDLSRT